MKEKNCSWWSGRERMSYFNVCRMKENVTARKGAKTCTCGCEWRVNARITNGNIEEKVLDESE